MLTARAARVFGGAHLVRAAVVALGVVEGLPARWWPVDVGAAMVVALDIASSLGLLARAAWGVPAARASSWLTLALGLAFTTAIAASASWLAGVYGPVGRGGAVLFVLVGALALPYLVVLPLVELVSLGPRAEVAGP